MHQPTLYRTLGVEEPSRDRSTVEEDALEVVDLFCGLGGFSEGARRAGCKVVLAVDSDPYALETYQRNHRDATHICTELPRATLPFPPKQRRWHLHCSPPCQPFSKINKKARPEQQHARACCLVEWCVELALSCGCTSWSIEQVAQTKVLEIMHRKRLESGGLFSFAVVDFELLGVPQTRKRLIAGTHSLVERLLAESRVQPRAAIRDVIPAPRGTLVRGTATGVGQRLKKNVASGEARYSYRRARWSDLCRRLDEPAPTVVGRHALTWITGRGERVNRSVLTPRELGLLQTLGSDYWLPQSRTRAYLQVGNCFPPLVAQLMLERRAPPERPDSPSWEYACG